LAGWNVTMQKRKKVRKKETVPLTHNPFASVLKNFKLKTDEKENQEKESQTSNQPDQ